MAPVAYLETSVLSCGDNLDLLPLLPAECIDLVYLDPPFFSNRKYEVIWGDEAEVRSFEDRWEGGINHYVEWMRPRVLQLHRVLKSTGSIYLHCDPTASHYLKVMLDDIFGAERFRNEITWQRTNTHSDAKRWSTVTDHAKGAKHTWNPQHLPHDQAYVANKYRYADADGRRYRLDNMTSPSPRPNMIYVWKGHEPPPFGWRYSRETMTRLDAEGRVWYPDSKAKRPQLKRYLDEMPGPIVADMWTDIPPINSRARERVGFPTQKPEALLERVLSASSNRGDIVLDPFCGCGTTLAVAQRLGRQWIGIDISPTAVRLIEQRMKKTTATNVRVDGLPETVDDLRRLKPLEFQNWVIQRVNGTHSPRKVGDMGIDGFSFLERLPIEVKQQDRVGRVVVDKFETAIRRHSVHKGYIIAFSFGRGAREEVARASREGLEIALVEVSTLLGAPAVVPRGGPREMLDDLLEGIRAAAESLTIDRPDRKAEELVASAASY